MRRIAWLWLVLALTTAVAFASAPVTQQTALPAPGNAEIGTPYNDGWTDVFPVKMGARTFRTGHLDIFDSTFFLDHFEPGDCTSVWTSRDLTDVGTFWHVNDSLPLGGSGMHWWCADTMYTTATTGGAYDNHWLQYLIADTLNFTGAATPINLNFKARWRVEVIAGATAPYDMWDGWNVWVSTDLGTSWTVLTPTAPAYSGASSYAFGEIWGMGSNIPAFGDTILASNNYIDIGFNLDAYDEQSNVLLRWAFASDDGFSGASDDSSFYGVMLDSIRVSDATRSVILSNDGTWDEFTVEQGPTAGNNWIYDNSSSHSPTHAWLCTPGYSLLCAIESFPIYIPTGYTIIQPRYYVWCDMPDSDGDGDNSLEDLYDIWVSDDNGVTYTRIAYDYGYDNGEPSPGGNSLTGWVRRSDGLTTGGTPIDLDLIAYAGQTIRLMFRCNTDDNDDGGVGTGLHIDDVEIAAQRAYAYDIEMIDLTIPFPTTNGLARPFNYTMFNNGLNNGLMRTKWTFWRPDATQGAETQIAYSGQLAPNNDTTFFATWTPDMVGSHLIRAFQFWVSDQDHSNDTIYSPTNVPLNPDSNLAVYVQPAGTYELAYHNRTRANAYRNPRYVHYTPLADGVPSGTVDAHDITNLKVMWQYANVLADTGWTVWIEFWGEGASPDYPGTLINRIETRIDTSETIGYAGALHWWNMDLAAAHIPGLQNRSGNFWVSVTQRDTTYGTNPSVMGYSVDPVVYDGHHYVIRWDSSSAFMPSPGRYLIQTTIKPTVYSTPAAPQITALRVGTTNDVVINWTAVPQANGYDVYRLNLPSDPPSAGTKLTALPVTGTSYTDVGVVALGAKYFYAVVAIN